MPAIALDQSQLRARAAVYRLLGRLWLQETDAALLRELRSPPLREAFVASGGTLPQIGDDKETLEDLAIDYCQLFLGPSGHLPPHQSVWADGHFQGAATAATEAQYAALNLPQPHAMADHLGSQLTAMAVIIERLATTPTTSPDALDAAQQFFSQHLAWTNELCQLATNRAQTAFYRSVVAMTHAFLADERTAWLIDA